MKNKLRTFFKRLAKPIGYCALATLVIFTTFYFGKCYISEGNNLNFTPEDVYILFLFGMGIFFISIILIYLVFKVAKLERALVEVLGEMADIEDNNIRFSRITQELILELSCKFGVDSSEKKS